MKTLTLLRHAKSAWDDPAGSDFDRPLNDRGHRAAHRIGRYLRDEALAFDHVRASAAQRVVETVAGVEAGYGRPLGAQYDRRLYLAPVPILLDLVHGIGDDCDNMLLIGHNPGLEELILHLACEDDSPLRAEVEVKYPTAALAELRFAASRWAEVGPNTGRIARFIRPRDLDSALGPDGS